MIEITEVEVVNVSSVDEEMRAKNVSKSPAPWPERQRREQVQSGSPISLQKMSDTWLYIEPRL